MAVDQPDGRRTAPATAIALAAFHSDAIFLAKWSNIIADSTNPFWGAKVAGKDEAMASETLGTTA
jgi:hypothetical protein